MRIVEEHAVIGKSSREHQEAVKEVVEAITGTHLVLNPTRKGNGVKPIKVGVVKRLNDAGWTSEHCMNLALMKRKPIDAFKRFNNVRVGFEWESGHIASSFRSLMKLIKGLVEDELDFGVLVVPSRAFYRFLTDRVGNISELLPYLAIFGKTAVNEGKGLIILVVEFDSLSESVALIPKGSDGMSLSRRKKMAKKSKKVKSKKSRR